MVREFERGLVRLCVFACLILAAAAQAQDKPETILIGFGEVPSDTRDCALLQGDADVCDPYYQRTVEALGKINHAIDSGLKKKARDGIDAALPYDDDRAWLFQTGVHLGVQELTIDEVRSDPVRRAIDDERRARKATSGSWVRHTIEVRPRVSLRVHPFADNDGTIPMNNFLLGFLPQFSVQIQVIKHYDLPVEFPIQPKERALSFKKLLTAHLKNYLQLPGEVGGGSLGPGESVLLESYLSASGLPSISNQFLSLGMGRFLFGGFARVGFEYFQTVHYRRYTIQKLAGEKLRVLLEAPSLKRWGPFADVGLSADLGIIDLDLSLARAGYRWLREKNFTNEYLVDLSSPEARTALKKAYLWGDFGPTDRLAEEDCQNDKGVSKTGMVDAKSDKLGTHARGWRVKILKWMIGSTRSRSDEVETPVSCAGLGPSIQSHVEELQRVRQGFRATRIYNVGIRTQQGKNNTHSLLVKYNYSGSSASHDEILEFLRIAKLIAEPSGDDENLARIKTELDAVSSQPNDKRSGRVHAYFSLEFDQAALSKILSMSAEERASRLVQAYNSLMEVDSENTREACDRVELTAADPGKYKDHLKDIHKFLEAAKRGVSQPNDLKAAQVFLQGIEHTGLDLYPFAALLVALESADHVVATAQLYLAGKTRDDDRLIDPSHAGRLFNREDPALVENADVPSQP